MGQLFDFRDKTIINRWYFSNIAAMEKEFPYICYIHQDYIEDGHSSNRSPTRIAIRRFINRQLIGDVIYHLVDMSYDYLHLYTKLPTYNSPHIPSAILVRQKIEHGYGKFHFEEEQDAVLFKIKFSEYVSEASPRHFKYQHVPEKEIEDAKARPWVGERW